MGFQASYSVDGHLKKGGMSMVDKKKMPPSKKFRLESGDHFKSVEVVVGGVHNTVIGLSLVSHNGVIAKGGCFNGNRKILSIPP